MLLSPDQMLEAARAAKAGEGGLSARAFTAVIRLLVPRLDENLLGDPPAPQ